jgi:hypothetical protein
MNKRIKRKWKSVNIELNFADKDNPDSLGAFYLPDKTAIIVKKGGGIIVGLTKTKFAKAFEGQLKNDSKYLSFEFKEVELKFMNEAIARIKKGK